MKLHIGLTSSSAGWQTILQQEGVPFSVLVSPDQLNVEGFSVVVVNDNSPKRWKGMLDGYLRAGGALLMTGENYQRHFAREGKRKSIRFLRGEPGSRFERIGLVDIFSTGTIYQDARLCPTNDGLPSVVVERVGNGIITVFPVDPGELVLDARTTQKYFYSPGGRHPSEHVSLVSRGGIRRMVHAALEYLHNERGLPYCHVWYFPDGAENVFAVRVDSDYGTHDEIESVYQFAEDHQIKLSWYLHTESHKSWLSRFASMDGHEIGIHCNEHAILKSYAGSRADIMKARELVQQQGISPVGFVAPFGVWSSELGKAIEEFGFLYSSEFSFDYDNLPSYPWMGAAWNSVLQIPIHPICIGSFRRLGSGINEMIEYFSRVVAWKRAVQEPLLFYHHPKDGCHPVLEFLIDALKRSGARSLLFRDFAAWWKERFSMNLAVEFDKSGLAIEGSLSPRVSLHITKGTQEALVPSGLSIDFSKVQWREKMPVPSLPVDITSIRSFSLHKTVGAFWTVLRRKQK